MCRGEADCLALNGDDLQQMPLLAAVSGRVWLAVLLFSKPIISSFVLRLR
jgi:hypothetical protein